MTIDTIRVFIGCGSSKQYDKKITAARETLQSCPVESRTLLNEFLENPTAHRLEELTSNLNNTPTIDEQEYTEAAAIYHKYKTKPVPAEELYTSFYAQQKQTVAELAGTEQYILSAKHHIIPAQEQITHYEETLRDKSADEVNQWERKVTAELREMSWGETVAVLVLAGTNYRSAVINFCNQADVTVLNPFGPTSGIGQQNKLLSTLEKRLKQTNTGELSSVADLIRSEAHSIGTDNAPTSEDNQQTLTDY